MAVSVTHSFVSAIPDGGDPTIVQPSNWNDDHVVTGLATVATTGAVSDLSGLGTGIATALAINTGSSGAPALFNGALGTPSSGTLTNCTSLPISTGVSGLGTGIATALTVNTGASGAPALINGALGTPSSGTLTNCTGLPAAGYATMVGDSGAGGTKGAVPAPAAGDATKFLRGDATWVAGTAAPVTFTISGKTANYTVVSGDNGTIIRFTGTGAVTCAFDAAATLGAGFNCWVINDKSTGILTLDPNGSETIQLATTATVPRGEGVQVFCDGTNLQFASNRRSVYFQIDNANTAAQPASASATGSIALGSATASGLSAIAISGQGTLSTASSSYAFALGSTSGGSGSQAVTGAGAMALGGSYASGTDSFAAAIANNTSTYGAKGANAVAIGAGLAKASGARALAMMNNAVASGDDSIAVGRSSTASATNSVALGFGAIAAIVGKYAYAGGVLSGAGSSQNASLNLIKATTDATASVLTSDAGAAAATNQVILPNNSAYAFDGLVIARRQAAGGTESASWKVEGHIRRDANAASTTLVASTVTAIDNTPGWTLALSADTTNGGLAVTFTGAAATNIRTVANIRTVEVTYA